jgi:hypothetical protein
MKRLSLGFAAAVSVIVAVAGAQAKAPPNGLDVCGFSACVHLEWSQAEPFWIAPRSSPARPSAPSNFYLVRWRWAATEQEQTSYYVPADRGFRWSSENGGFPVWMSLSEQAVRPLDRATEGLEPYAVQPPTEVTVGGKAARGPETYLRLYRGPNAGFAPVVRWLKVEIRSVTPSPWTDGQIDLKISARGRLVLTNGWVHRISLRLANQARRGLPLAP